MEIEDFKVDWQKLESVHYSDEELQSIYQIRQTRTLSALAKGFTLDLVLALMLTAIFIVILQTSNLQNSNFWSFCLSILALQHLVFHQLQMRLIKRYSQYSVDVSTSIKKAATRLKMLLWLYRIWPATLTLILYAFYLIKFSPNLPLWQIIPVGMVLSMAIAGLSYFMSAILIRKHYTRLKKLDEELTGQMIH